MDYLTKIENMVFCDAVSVITGVTPITAPPKCEAEPPKTLILPEKAGVSIRLYDYLCIKRSIDSDIIQTLIQKEMLYEDRRGNVVFVGHDEHGKPRFACLRGTHGDFRGDCAGSDKRYGFHTTAIVPSERLYIFESAIDLMSHADLENLPFDTMVWQENHRLSLSGTSDTAIPFFLNQHEEVKELVFCLDNDTAGHEAAVNLARKYADKGYYTRLELPHNKDFNDDLTAFKRENIAEKSPKPKHDICI